MKVGIFFSIVCVTTYMYMVDGDCYLSSPKGSNNRLNEKTAQRRNNNRVFDSQNNARGGYNVGDLTHEAAGTDASKQYQLRYVMSPLDVTKGESVLPIEWTNQHGCGKNTDDDPNKLNCNIVIQYMCQPSKKDAVKTAAVAASLATGGSVTAGKMAGKMAGKVAGAAVSKDEMKDEMRDGTSTQTNDYEPPKGGETYETFKARKDKHVQHDRVLQEPFEWYDKCATRSRNKGLFVADQKVEKNSAQHTRQNPKGKRSGYECPEERDYYPYWHPTPWKDIMVLAEREERCAYYKKFSFNVHSKFECVEEWPNQTNQQKKNPPKHYSKHNNKFACEAVKGVWTEYHNYLEILHGVSPDNCKSKNETGLLLGELIWGRPMLYREEKCLVRLHEPLCREAPYSRVNHLGNGVDLEPLHIKWKIPAFPSGQRQKCVLRIRYNISTDDYNPEKIGFRTIPLKTFSYTDKPSTDKPSTDKPASDKTATHKPLRLKIMCNWNPLPRQERVGKMYAGVDGDEKFKGFEYFTWENTQGKKGPCQWLGWQDKVFANELLDISFWIKFVEKVPVRTNNFGMKVYGKIYNEFVDDCKADTWCYVQMTVKCKNHGDGHHVILIFDSINHKQKIHVAKLTVQIVKLETPTPIKNDPVVNIGANGQGLELAIDTSQFGRTFQDRSHTFFLKKMDIFESDTKLHTITVRGKRGNIVQTFPAVEYDFYPTNLTMREKDMVYFTWTGSNTHENNGNGGDGRAGNDGQGTKGTDRNNVCGLRHRDLNFVLPVEHPENICQNIKRIVWSSYPISTTTLEVDAKLDACIQLMSSGYYKCFRDHSEICTGESLISKEKKMDDLLNNAPASYPGIILQLKPGVYHYMCSRNNAFTNRSQKGSIHVIA